MRRNSWICVFAWAMSAAAPIAGIFATVQTAIAADDPDLEKSLLATVTSDKSTDALRQNAAAQLVEADTADKGGPVLIGLQNPVGRLALVKAIASARTPNKKWIDALGGLLGPNRAQAAQTRVAAQALANYAGNAQAFSQMKDFVDAAANYEPSRVEVVLAMGGLIDKEPADYLVHQLSASTQIREAAAHALAQMTGLTDNGANAALWQQWSKDAAGKTPDQFRAALLAGRGGEAQRLRQLQDDAAKLVSDLYYRASDSAKKAEIALKYLSADSAIVRRDVITLINANLQANAATDEVKDRLVEMIDDPDEQVRQSVVNVLMTSVSDPGKLPKLLPALVNRLKIEQNPQVKVNIATALAKFGDPKTAGVLLDLLKNGDPDVAIAAAKALSGTLGSNLHHDDPATAQSASAIIRDLLKKNPNEPQPRDFRAALVAALAMLQDSASLNDFSDMVLPAEPPEVRRAALQGLALLGNNKSLERVKIALGANERDASIRLEAARALGAVAAPADAQYIKNQMTSDADPKVRDALRDAMVKVFDQMTPDDLNTWAGILNSPPDKDPDLRLTALVKYGNALKAKGGPTADDDIAANQQDIAQAMMASSKPTPMEAIEILKAAIEHWRAAGPAKQRYAEGSMSMNQLISDLLEDELSAKQYKEATDFAAAQITIKPEYQQTVGSIIKNESDRLSSVDPNAARTLIDEALHMNPSLDTRFVNQLQAIKKQLPPPGP